MTAGFALHKSLERTSHRPWPLPNRKWDWRQTWNDLLFAHWPVPAAELRPLVPDRLTIHEFQGTAWLGVVPFRMTGVMRRPLPDLPWISAFPELNLRTYVDYGDKPGVWFLSLDAGNPLAVWAARRFFHLPYFHSRIKIGSLHGQIDYRAVRRGNPAGLTFAARYKPISEPYKSVAGSLEHWLTERYCLYAIDRDGSLYRTEIHHPPWPLQRASAEIEHNDLPDPHGLVLSGEPPQLHFSRRLEVVVWNPELVTASGAGGSGLWSIGDRAPGSIP